MRTDERLSAFLTLELAARRAHSCTNACTRRLSGRLYLLYSYNREGWQTQRTNTPLAHDIGFVPIALIAQLAEQLTLNNYAAKQMTLELRIPLPNWRKLNRTGRVPVESRADDYEQAEGRRLSSRFCRRPLSSPKTSAFMHTIRETSPFAKVFSFPRSVPFASLALS